MLRNTLMHKAILLFLNSTVQSLSTLYFLLVLRFWLTLDTKTIKWWLLNLNTLLSPHDAPSGEKFHLIDFVRQLVGLAGKIILLDWIFQQSCRFVREHDLLNKVSHTTIPHKNHRISLNYLLPWPYVLKEMIDRSFHGYMIQSFYLKPCDSVFLLSSIVIDVK